MNRDKDITREERELLTLLRARPEMYLGCYAGLHEFVEFVRGYEVAAMRHNLHEVRLLPEGFQEFVEERFTGETGGAYSWWHYIMQAEPDNRAALGYFWLILNEYLFLLECSIIPPPARMPESHPHEDGIDRIWFTDLSRLAESYMRTFNGEPWWDRWDKKTALHRLEDIYRTPGFAGCAIWKDGTLLGAVMGRSERYFDGDCFQIIELWVEPRVQRGGWGRKLLDALRDILRTRNVRKLFLITMPADATAGFYRNCGFTMQDGMCIMQLDTSV